MTSEAIKFINSNLKDLGINFEFGQYTGEHNYPIFDTIYAEFESMSEDGKEQGTFVLTGTTDTSFLDLENIKNKVKARFTNLGLRTVLPNGNGLVVTYVNSIPIPTADGVLKRIQINLSVKEWVV